MGQLEETYLQNRLNAVTDALHQAEARAIAGSLALEVMHEIRSPLETLSYLHYLAMEGAEDSVIVRKNLVLAEEQIAAVSDIANQALGFARPSRTTRTIHLGLLADSAVRLHRRAIEAKAVSLIRDIADDAAASVHSGEMLQVISNLLLNAIDALEPNGTIHLRFHRTRSEVKIIIADNGSGIPAELLPTIFEPFVTTKEERGNGLGLSLSKKIVERHKGKICLRSSIRPGRSGTTFKISLPV